MCRMMTDNIIMTSSFSSHVNCRHTERLLIYINDGNKISPSTFLTNSQSRLHLPLCWSDLRPYHGPNLPLLAWGWKRCSCSKHLQFSMCPQMCHLYCAHQRCAFLHPMSTDSSDATRNPVQDAQHGRRAARKRRRRKRTIESWPQAATPW